MGYVIDAIEFEMRKGIIVIFYYATKIKPLFYVCHDIPLINNMSLLWIRNVEHWCPQTKTNIPPKRKNAKYTLLSPQIHVDI